MAYFQGATLVLGRVGYIGDYMTQLYIGILPSHDKDPDKPLKISWNVKRVVCFALLRCLFTRFFC